MLSGDYKFHDYYKLLRIASAALNAIENGTPADVLFSDKEVSTWWAMQKLAQSKAQEEKEKKELVVKAKKTALSKLTLEEANALGLRRKKV